MATEGDLLFDIEANGLLDTVTKIHCIVIKDVTRGKALRYNDGRTKSGLQITEGVKRLEKATQEGRKIIAHNGVKYDVPAIRKLLPWFNPVLTNVYDTLVVSRLIFTNLGDTDATLLKKGTLPGKLYKSHSLEAWGYRLGNFKDDYDGGWEEWSLEMEDYCVQDVEALHTLYKHLSAIPYTQQAIDLEHAVAHIIGRQERKGFLFNQEKAVELYGTLSQRRSELEDELRVVFKPRLLRKGKQKVPKRDNKTRGYIAGAPFSPVVLTQFNPGSRDQIGHWLKHMFGWVPTELTETGKPKIDEDVLKPLKYPEAQLLCEYFIVAKRVGQLAEGDKAWLKHIKNDGRIHGSVNSCGAVTGRMTHANPNVAQVPSCGSIYGHECRELFTVPAGFKLIGADASGLELRCLASFMARYDAGKYIATVISGIKDEGTDIHSVNMRALGLTDRDIAKTYIYAYLYGAGDYKLGTVVLSAGELRGYYQSNKTAIDRLYQQRRSGRKPVSKKECVYIYRGKQSRDLFERNIPALAQLTIAVKAKAKTQGYLKGLDGRKLHVRSDHAALNTLLQSAGAVILKQALVLLDSALQQDHKLTPGVDYEFVANIHDEYQIEVLEKHAETVGKACVAAMETAGILLKFKCPITGEYAVGSNWAETH